MHVLTLQGLGATRACLRYRPWRPGDPGDSEFVCDEWGAPETTTPVTVAPPAPRSCEELYNTWITAHPEYRSCLIRSPEPFRKWVDLCTRTKAGTLPNGFALWNDYVMSFCAPPPPPQTEIQPPPPPPPPPPTAPPETPPGVPIPGETPDDLPPLLDPNGDGEAPPESVSQRDWRRNFGPIVGIGLFVAAGLTVYRIKRKKGKRR